jgi:hypothetical protein
VNVYRPGRVDTAMQAWIRRQDPARGGGGLVDRFAAACHRSVMMRWISADKEPVRRRPGTYAERDAQGITLRPGRALAQDPG